MRKILSIDGGGIKGIFPASFLATVEDSVGEPISEYFDLIVGTSTGGILALALGLGLASKDILRFYETFCPIIFSGNRFTRGLAQLGVSKYRTEPLRKALAHIFGAHTLADSGKRLVIPSFDLETGEVHVSKRLRIIRNWRETTRRRLYCRAVHRRCTYLFSDSP